VHADRAAAVAAGLGAITGCAAPELLAHGGLVALADLERASDGEHARAARPARPRARRGAAGDDAVDQLGHGESANLHGSGRVRRGVGQHDVRQPGHAGRAVQQRQPDARAEPEGHQHIAGDGRGGELAHPDHRLRHA
jgi:hypothetical protein